jgi:fibronectin type 3 domain-containing protein
MKSKRRFVEAFILSVFLCLATSLSAATPWLHTDANLIKDPSGNIVVLRGLDTIDIGSVEMWRSGVIYLIDRITNKSDSSGSSPGWYPRVIRLAVYPKDETDTSGPWYWEDNHDDYYNNLLRPVVDYCKTKDLYAIIDWHYVGDNTYDKVSQTSAFWSYIAPKFAGDSHVLFELFNEPGNTGGSDSANWATCKPNMQTWIDIIRASAPNNLILVGAPSWSQQVGPAADSPLTGTNLVMVVHLYPGHWTGLYGDPEGYKNQVRRCITHYPLFATEWGFRSSLSGNLQGTIANYGQPLMDFYESFKISNSAWVTDYAWQPEMFDSSWNLRVGSGEMGGFVKDTLYARRNDDQPSENDTVPPDAPTDLSAVPGNGVVSLNWNDNGEGDLAGYNVYRSTISGGPYTKLNGSLLSSSNYSDNSVTNGTTYYYVVTAVDMSSNESDNSNQVSATPYADTMPPAAPTGLAATAGEGTVSLNWNDNTEGDLAGYNVYRSTISGGPYTKLNGSLLVSSAYIDNSVTNGTTYYYVVRAVDTSSNESGNSNQVPATPINLPPAVPTGLAATAGSGTVTLDWSDNGEGDLAGYNAYRSTISGGPYTKLNGSLLVSSNYTDNSVTNGTTYYYVVTAVDTGSNESGYSGQVSATPHIITDVNILGSWVSGNPHTHIKESGTNRELIFIAHAEHTADVSLTSVMYGGQPMTKVVERVVSSGSPVYYAYVVAYILNEQGVAAATSGTFVPAWSTSPSAVAYESVFLQNVDQSTTIGASASNGTTSSNPVTTTALSTNNGNMVIDAATCGNNGSYTLNNGFTEGADQSVGDYGLTGAAGYKSATGAGETPSATHSSSINRQVIIGFVVNAQAAPVYSNCGEVIAAGHRLPSDLSGDCYVNYLDVNTMADYWLNGECNAGNNYCGLSDFEPRDGAVDFFDFSDFAMQWLVCNDPEGINCTPNW